MYTLLIALYEYRWWLALAPHVMYLSLGAVYLLYQIASRIYPERKQNESIN